MRNWTNLPVGLVGEVIGDRYQLLEIVAPNPVASVFKAEDISAQERRVTVAVLRYYRDEWVNTMQRLVGVEFGPGSHLIENVIVLDDCCLVILGEVEGETLEAFIDQNGPLLPQEVEALMSQVLTPISILHHFDMSLLYLNPSLIFRDGMDRWSIIALPAPLNTMTPLLMWDPWETVDGVYSAPEHDGEVVPSKRGDIFSLGAVAAFAATNKHPAFDTAMPWAFQEYASALPVQLANVINGCIEPEVAKRFESGLKLLEALGLAAPVVPDSLPPARQSTELLEEADETKDDLVVRELRVLPECNLGRVSPSTVVLDEVSIGWVDRHGQAFISDIQDSATVVHLRSPRGEAFSIALRSEKSLVATGHDSSLVCLWTKAGRLLKVLDGGQELSICHIKISPNGDWVVAVDAGMTMYIFDTESATCVHTGTLENLEALEIGYDGYTLFTDNSTYILNAGMVIPGDEYQGESLRGVASAHDGRTFASVDSSVGVSLRFINEGLIYQVLDMDACRSRALCFNPSDTLLAELGETAQLRLHSLSENYALHVAHVHQGVCAVNFSGERTVRMAGVKGDDLVVWETNVPD